MLYKSTTKWQSNTTKSYIHAMLTGQLSAWVCKAILSNCRSRWKSIDTQWVCGGLRTHSNQIQLLVQLNPNAVLSNCMSRWTILTVDAHWVSGGL